MAEHYRCLDGKYTLAVSDMLVPDQFGVILSIGLAKAVDDIYNSCSLARVTRKHDASTATGTAAGNYTADIKKTIAYVLDVFESQKMVSAAYQCMPVAFFEHTNREGTEALVAHVDMVAATRYRNTRISKEDRIILADQVSHIMRDLGVSKPEIGVFRAFYDLKTPAWWRVSSRLAEQSGLEMAEMLSSRER